LQEGRRAPQEKEKGIPAGTPAAVKELSRPEQREGTKKRASKGRPLENQTWGEKKGGLFVENGPQQEGTRLS